MNVMTDSPVAGWDAVDDPWNYGKLKFEDRRWTDLIKQIALVDGGTAHRVVCYAPDRPYAIDGNHVAERMVESVDAIPDAVAELDREVRA